MGLITVLTRVVERELNNINEACLANNTDNTPVENRVVNSSTVCFEFLAIPLTSWVTLDKLLTFSGLVSSSVQWRDYCED